MELGKLLGLDPTKDYRHAHLDNIDVKGLDLRGLAEGKTPKPYNFTGSSLRGANFEGAYIEGVFLTTQKLMRMP